MGEGGGGEDDKNYVILPSDGNGISRPSRWAWPKIP